MTISHSEKSPSAILNECDTILKIRGKEYGDYVELFERMAERFNAHLADHEFLAADRFSIADITLFITCGFCRVMKWAPHKEHENLGRWYDAMKARGFAG